MPENGNKKESLFDEIKHLLVLLGLLFILLLILSWTNILPCSKLPGWCAVFYKIKGAPNILIVYGDSGMGDPIILKNLLSNRDVVPKQFGGNVILKKLDLISLDTLEQYDVVIVERARKITTAQMQIFSDYITKNPRQGKLIWTGDAGTEMGADDEIYAVQKQVWNQYDLNYTIETEKYPSPLARKTQDGRIIEMNKLLGVKYLFSENYGNEQKLIGTFAKALNNSYTRGIKEGISIYSKGFVINEVYPDATILGVLEAAPRPDLNIQYERNSVPLITTNLNGRIAYYSIPPEWLFDKERNIYKAFILNMYEGILGI
jgi:hypothetical protein